MKNYSYIHTIAAILLPSLLILNCSGINSGVISRDLSSDFSVMLAEEMVLTSPTAPRVPGSLLSVGPEYIMLGDVVAKIGPSAEESPKVKKEAQETLRC